MFQEEIARLTGRLVFQVDNRPLATFEKKLGGVLTMLRELSTLANKKFTVKVSLDSRSLRGQIEKATKTKISLTNVDISQEALAVQGKKIQEYLDKTPIRLTNIKIDVAALVGQKRFVKTLMGQMDLKLPVKLDLMNLERELKAEIAAIGKRQKIQVEGNLNVTQFIIKLRRALKHAQQQLGPLKLRIHDPQVRLKVDKQHLIEEIKAAIASSEFKIRIGARRDVGGNLGERGERTGRGRTQADRGLSAAMGFARGALPGLGAAFAFSQMNDISQKVIAANNSLEAVSGNQANFKSNKNFLNNLSNEQGLNFRDMAPQYSSIYQAASPSIGVKGTQDMFRGITKYGTVHGIDKEAMKGSMVALSQMFGKDKIQAEEARQQFSERMPGGMALLAKAAGTDVKGFSEMMQKGKADPKKILPELGRLMEELADKNNAYEKSLKTTRVAQGRMNKAFEDSVMIFSAGGFDKGMGGFFNTMADSMKRATPLISALGAAFDILIRPLNALIRIFGYIGEHWDQFAKKLGVSKEALATFATAIGVFMLPFGGFITAIGLAALALDDLLTWNSGGKSVFGDFLKETPEAQTAVDKLSGSWTTFKGNIADTTAAIISLLEKMGLLSKATSEVNFSPTFISTLDKLSSILNALGAAIDAVGKLASGDMGGIADALKTMKSSLEAYATQNLTDFATGALRTGAQMIIDNRPMGVMPGEGSTPATGTIDRSGAPVVNMGGITIQVTAPAGTSDPQQFAESMAPHFENLMDGALAKALGKARLQQAER